MNKPDGGPAFPRTPLSSPNLGFFEPPSTGMSLRAWLAGQALAGLTSQQFVSTPEWIAQKAVSIADGTIAELERE